MRRRLHPIAFHVYVHVYICLLITLFLAKLNVVVFLSGYLTKTAL